MVFKQAWSLGLALAASSAAATDAPILSVTLCPGSATVERVVQVAPGATQVEITGLLANFDKDTVRLQADPGIQVGQVVTRDQARADSPSQREADLDARVQALQDQIAAIDADIKSAQIVQGYLERLGAGGARRTGPRSIRTRPPSTWNGWRPFPKRRARTGATSSCACRPDSRTWLSMRPTRCRGC